MKIRYLPFYISKDKFEIYTLLSVGCILDGFEPDDRGALHFRFVDKEKCEQILSQLRSKKLKVYAHEMINAIRDAQAIFHNK